jgi:hypothetical protein
VRAAEGTVSGLRDPDAADDALRLNQAFRERPGPARLAAPPAAADELTARRSA